MGDFKLYMLHLAKTLPVDRGKGLATMAKCFALDEPTFLTQDLQYLHAHSELQKICAGGYDFILAVAEESVAAAREAAAEVVAKGCGQEPGLVIVEGCYLRTVVNCLEAIDISVEFEDMGHCRVTSRNTFIHVTAGFDTPRSCHTESSADDRLKFSMPSLPRDRTAVLQVGVAPPAMLELPSNIGSRLHHKGKCRPCVYFVRQRCLNGDNCTYCHVSTHKRGRGARRTKNFRHAHGEGDEEGSATPLSR